MSFDPLSTTVCALRGGGFVAVAGTTRVHDLVTGEVIAAQPFDSMPTTISLDPTAERAALHDEGGLGPTFHIDQAADA